MSEPKKHEWKKQEDGNYKCINCGKKIGWRTYNAIESAIKIHGAKLASNIIYCDSEPEKSEEIQWDKIEKLFVDKKVVVFDEIKLFMGNDPELFWEGDEENEGMFDFLEQNGFEVVPCREKNEKLLTEIYVNFDKFKERDNSAKVDVSISEPAKNLSEIDVIKKMSEELAKSTQKGFVEVSIYSDGFKLFFSRELKVDDERLKQRVLEQLSRELEIEFVDT